MKIDECLANDPQSFWAHIKKLGPMKKQTIPMCVEINGLKVTDPNLVLEKWRAEYEHLYNATDDKYFDQDFKNSEMKLLTEEDFKLKVEGDEDHLRLNRPISFGEVKKAVTSSKPRKAAGFDNITNELLRHDSVIKLLQCLFNICIKLKIVPGEWRKAIIHPIPKTKDFTMDPLKYRGLALQSCIFKIYSNIINTQVVERLEKYDVFTDLQNGFRKNWSCQHHIFTLLMLIRNTLKVRKFKSRVFGAFIDFRKAFDYIDRDLMLLSLSENGIKGPILETIRQIYSCTSNVIRLNGAYSEKFDSTKGVLQGNNISPTIFCNFINGLMGELENSGEGIKIGNTETVPALAYADDIVLLATTESGLVKLLRIVEMWTSKWRVEVNVNKTKIVHFRSKSTPKTQQVFKLHGDLEIVESYKYLGFTVDSQMTPELGISELVNAASWALGAIITNLAIVCSQDYIMLV